MSTVREATSGELGNLANGSSIAIRGRSTHVSVPQADLKRTIRQIVGPSWLHYLRPIKQARWISQARIEWMRDAIYHEQIRAVGDILSLEIDLERSYNKSIIVARNLKCPCQMFQKLGSGCGNEAKLNKVTEPSAEPSDRDQETGTYER